MFYHLQNGFILINGILQLYTAKMQKLSYFFSFRETRVNLDQYLLSIMQVFPEKSL